MSVEEITKTHIHRMLDWAKQDLFIERRFTSAESWNKTSTEESFRYRGIFRDREPVLQKVLQHSKVLILGEPGSGKSGIAKAAVCELAEGGNSIPVPALLKSYRGNLRQLLEKTTSADILDNPKINRTYVLDGLDEVPAQLLGDFAKELSRLSQTDPVAKFLITSRQAFHAKHPSVLSIECDVFHILDFGDSDVRKFAEANGLSSEEFLKAVAEAGCDDEITNPFILSVMVKRCKEEGQLSPLRSENVAYIVDQLIATRPNINAKRQRRALRMLGVACETYCRNELAEDEALKVLLEAIEIPESQARELLDELSHSILIRTSSGIAFQMRSHGEFLAAEELENQDLDRIKELAFFDDDTPNDSWMNAISYLAEFNAQVRRYFLRNHPEWMFSVSPAAFSEEERTSLCSGFIEQLNRSGQLVIDQQIVRPRKLARLLTDEVLHNLISKVESSNIEEAANAIALTGIRGRTEIVPLAVSIAKQTERGDPVRSSAIIALVNSADHTVINELIPVLKPDSPYHINLVDCIGSLACPQDIPKVLPLLLRTDAMLSAAYYRFREFRSKEFVISALKYLLENPREFQARRVDAYLEPAIEQIPDHWDNELEEICAQIIIALDDAHVYPSSRDLADKFVIAIEQVKSTEGFVRRVLTQYIAVGKQPLFYNEVLARFITRDVANWLASAGQPELIKRLATSVSDTKIRSILAPVSDGVIAAQDQYQGQYFEEQRKKAEKRKTEIEEKQSIIASSDKFPEVVTQLHALNQEDWPDLEPDRLKWLSKLISENLISFDLEKRITHSGTSWTTPSWLKPLLDIVGHYSLQLPEDSTLVLALRAWPETSIIEYFRKHGFSDKAKNLLKDMLSQTIDNRHIITNILTFLRSAKYPCNDLLPELELIAKTKALEGYSRINAVELIATVDGATTLLEGLNTITDDKSVSDVAFGALVERQHRPTIEKALSKLLADDDILKAGEVGRAETTPLDWIAKIRESFAWDKLVAVRNKTLRLELPNLAQVVAVALKRIDPDKVHEVVRKQIPSAPATWKRAQQGIATEYEREARLIRARATPFDIVVAKLKGSTSMIALKVWCEGPTDRPVFRAFFRELGELRIAETVDFVAGWPALVGEDVPERWLDGCRRAVIIMDGDNGRQLTKSKRPETKTAKDVKKRFARLPITLYILQRYGIENYFPQGACEAALERHLSAYFPLPETVPIEHHFIERKNLWDRLKMALQKKVGFAIGKSSHRFFFKSRHNELIAQHLRLADVAGTDLKDILDAIAKEAQDISGK